MKKIIFILLLISFSTLRAEVEEKHPIIDDLYAKKYVLNLKEMSTDDLKVEKLKLTDILKNINAKFDKDKSEKEIFKTLMEYDEERIKIVFVLKDICKEYKVSKNIQDLLYRYSNTFEETIRRELLAAQQTIYILKEDNKELTKAYYILLKENERLKTKKH